MDLIPSGQAWADYLSWQNDAQTLERIHVLLKDIQLHPFEGIGKPEPLQHALAGFWSRRIDGEHRIVYRPTPGGIQIAQLRYHYCAG